MGLSARRLRGALGHHGGDALTSAGRPPQALAWAAAGCAALLGALALAHWDPAGGPPPFCVLRRAFGLPCPGCGMTRALALLARGDWAAALAMHPWAPVVAAQLGLAWLLWGTGLLRPGAGAGWRSRLGPVLAANLAALAALWLGRLATGTLPL